MDFYFIYCASILTLGVSFIAGLFLAHANYIKALKKNTIDKEILRNTLEKLEAAEHAADFYKHELDLFFKDNSKNITIED